MPGHERDKEADVYRRETTADLEWFGYSLLTVSVAALFVPLWGGDLPRRLLLPKPFTVEALVSRVRQAIDRPPPA